MNINEHEQKVLVFLADEFHGEGYGFGFASIMQETGLDRRLVRLACRSLKRKGMTEFYRGLWTEDGEPAGSGYGATKAGVQFAEGFPRLCDGCGKNDADPPSKYCPGCGAYAEHQR